MKTTDGGASWTSRSIPAGFPRALSFVDPRHGWALMQSLGTLPGQLDVLVFRTDDGGQTWNHTPVSATSITSWEFIDSTTASLGTFNGDILRTSDAGRTWQYLGSSHASAQRLILSDPRAAYSLVNGEIHVSRDRGRTWSPRLRRALDRAQISDSGSAQSWGWGGPLLLTRNMARGWRRFGAWKGCSPDHASFADRNEGYVLCDEGRVIGTRDGGETWSPFGDSPLPPSTVVGFGFKDSMRGWICDRSLAFRSTIDGGKTWSESRAAPWSAAQPGPASLPFIQAATFAEASGLWAVGSRGTIYHLPERGEWTTRDPGTKNDLLGVEFLDQATGWLVGQKGTVLGTRDSGQTWHLSRDVPTDQDLLAVSIVDPQHAWAVGRRGTIIATADGGTSWTKQENNVEESLIAVHF